MDLNHLNWKFIRRAILTAFPIIVILTIFLTIPRECRSNGKNLGSELTLASTFVFEQIKLDNDRMQFIASFSPDYDTPRGVVNLAFDSFKFKTSGSFGFVLDDKYKISQTLRRLRISLVDVTTGKVSFEKTLVPTSELSGFDSEKFGAVTIESGIQFVAGHQYLLHLLAGPNHESLNTPFPFYAVVGVRSLPWL